MKGNQNEECNVTSCSNNEATWFNHSTRAWYCKSCAMKLNYYNSDDAKRHFKHKLLTQDTNTIYNY